MGFSLYDLTEESAKLQMLLEECADEELLTVIQEALDLNAADLSDKLEACGKVQRNLATQAEAIEAEGKRLVARAKRIASRADGLKARMLEAMQQCEVNEVDGALLSLKRRKTPAKVIIDDQEAVEKSAFCEEVVSLKIDKRGIASAIKAGEEVAGCHMESGERLVIE